MDLNKVYLTGIFFVVLFAQMLIYPDLERLAVAVGLSEGIADSSLFILAEYIPFMISAVVVGAYSDSISNRNSLIRYGAFSAALSYLALALLPSLSFSSLGLFLFIRAWQGASVAAMFILAMTKFLDFKGSRGRNMGMAGVSLGLAPAFGFPIGGVLYGISVVAPLIATAFLFGVVCITSFFIRDDLLVDGESTVSNIVNLKGRTDLLVPYSFHFVDRLTGGFIALGATFYLREEFGLAASDVGQVLFAFFLPYALLQPLMGRLTDRIGRYTPLVVGSVLYGLGIGAIGVVGSLNLVLVVLVFAAVFGALMVPASLALAGDFSGENDKGTVIGGLNVFGSLGYLVGVAFSGLVTGLVGYSGGFVVFGLMQVVVSLALIIYLIR